ncbi:hypothetical protein BGX20_002185, partial [Mortierella sp. AD010]
MPALYFRKRYIPVNVKICLLAADVYDIWSARVGELRDHKDRTPTWLEDWVRRFKESWRLVYHKMVGEARSVVWSQIEDEVKKISQILDKYDLDDINNCDKSGCEYMPLNLCPFTKAQIEVQGDDEER